MPRDIKIELKEANSYTRRPCHVCGGCTGKVSILAEGRHEGHTIRVCESCLEAGNTDERLLQHARELEAWAVVVRELVGRLQVPTYAEYLARHERHETAMHAAHVTRDDENFDLVMKDDNAYAKWREDHTASEMRREAAGEFL